MSKYSTGHLKRMAAVVLQAKQDGSGRYDYFVMNMVLRTGMTYQAVGRKIQEMANA